MIIHNDELRCITPTLYFRFVKRLTYKILQQRWDTSICKEGIWTVTSEWKDVPIEEENHV